MWSLGCPELWVAHGKVDAKEWYFSATLSPLFPISLDLFFCEVWANLYN